MEKYVIGRASNEYIRFISSVSPRDWIRYPQKDYDTNSLHQEQCVEKYTMRFHDEATLIFSVSESDKETNFVMEVEFDNEKGTFYEIEVLDREKERLTSEYQDLIESIHANREEKFIDRINSIFKC